MASRGGLTPPSRSDIFPIPLSESDLATGFPSVAVPDPATAALSIGVLAAALIAMRKRSVIGAEKALCTFDGSTSFQRNRGEWPSSKTAPFLITVVVFFALTHSTSSFADQTFGPLGSVKITGSGGGTDIQQQQNESWNLSAEMDLSVLSTPTQQGDLLIYPVPNAKIHLVFSGVAIEKKNLSNLQLNFSRDRNITIAGGSGLLRYSISQAKVVFIQIPIPDNNPPPGQPKITSISFRDGAPDPFPNIFVAVDFPSPWLFDGNYHVAATPEKQCGGPTLVKPSFDPFTAHGWKFTAEVTADDGLQVNNVSLKNRHMATKINLPYYKFATTSASGALLRCELKPDSPDATCRSRLVELKELDSASALVIQASYAVDKIPGDVKSCLWITQRYEFHAVKPGDRCEPTGGLPCARFYPTVSYRFETGPSNEELLEITLPQRLHFEVDSPGGALIQPNAAAIIKDKDFGLPPTDALENPQTKEVSVNAVFLGSIGEWDNVHQTNRSAVDLPLLNPGCPECVHIHWRWGVQTGSGFFPGFSDFNGGAPRIPLGSNQSINFAIVRFHDSEQEQDPQDYTSLYQQPEQLAGNSLVLWYAPTGFQQSDKFFEHGGFFVPPPRLVLPAEVSVRRGGLRRNLKSGHWVQQVEITNTGESDFPSPISLVLDNLNSGGSLADPTGHTFVVPAGLPYKDVPTLLGSPIRPRQSATVVLEFTHPSNQVPTYAPSILVGPGPR